MKKFRNWFLLVSLIVSMALLTACSTPKLPDGFKEEEVETAAKEVIDLLNAHDGKSLRDMSIVKLQEAFTDDVMSKVFAQIDEASEFKEIEQTVLTGTRDKNSDEEFAVVLIKAKYELKNITYTISFTRQMKLAGLYMK